MIFFLRFLVSQVGLKCSQTAMSYDHASDRYGLGEPNFETLDSVDVHLKEPNIAHFTDKTGKTHQVRKYLAADLFGVTA